MYILPIVIIHYCYKTKDIFDTELSINYNYSNYFV